MNRDVTRFAVVWVASLLSGVGSALTGFVLGVWVYQSTSSPTQFALVLLCGLVPGILAGPVAGVLVDRFDRRLVLVVTDCLAAVPTLAVALLAGADLLAVWHVCVATAITAACAAVHLTTYQAMTPLLIPERHLARANGLMQVAWAAQIAAPVLAGALMVGVGLAGVLLIDLVTFAVAVLTLLVVRLPATVVKAPSPERGHFSEGWRHLRSRPELLGLVLVQSGFNFAFATAGVLVQPLILSFADADVLGVLMLAGGAGMFCGSLAMGAWGGPRDRIGGMALFMGVGGVALFLHTLQPSPLLVGAAAAAFLFTLPVVNGCAQAVLQSAVDRDLLGRVLGTANSLGSAATPVAYLLAAPFAEFVTGPLLMPDGALAGSFGVLVGTGPGRGIAFVLLLDAVLLAALALVTALRLRQGVRDAARI